MKDEGFVIRPSSFVFRKRGIPMEWGQSKNLIWLWAVVAAAVLFALSAWRRRGEMKKIGDPALVERLIFALNPALRFAKRTLILLALVCMVLAFAQPHFRKKETLVERRGIDIMIAIDVSNSMLARDIAPTRLEKAKLELARLVDQLKGNRIGIVAFAGEALIQCPLTHDRNAAKLFITTVGPNLISFQGTSLGKAIYASLQAFGDKDKQAKALILLTDGEEHDPEALQAAKQAKTAGVRIFSVGIGTPDGSTLPDESGRGYKKDLQGNVVISRLNEALLKRVADEAGGAYFHAAKGELDTEKLLRAIRQITQKDFGKDWSVEYEENFQFFAALAFLFLLAEWALPEGKRIGESG